MKKSFISSGLIMTLMIFVLGACGGSSSSGGGGGGTATSDEVVQAMDAAVTSTLRLLLDDDPLSSVAAQVNSAKNISPLDCTWYNESDVEIPADVSSIATVAKWVCPASCDPTGTETNTITNTLGTPFFVGTPFADGIINTITYDACDIETVCGPATLAGTLTITGTGFLTNPCAATLTIVSTDITVDGTTSASVNMTLNITAAGECNTVTTIDCENNLSADSTMTVGTTTYNKTQICDMIDNPTC